MGFSITITSSIILIVLLAVSSSFLIAVFQGLKEMSYIAKEYVNRERETFDVALELTVDSVNATSCNVTVKNTGAKVIFLRNQTGFNWNTIILSYTGDSLWKSYSIEEYEIIEVRVSETNYTFNPESHSFINSGEEALLSFSIPNEAPEIPSQGLVCVVFVTHYGVSVKGEAVREQ